MAMSVNHDSSAFNGGSSAVPESMAVGPTEVGLKHNVGLSIEWTPDEQSLLEELLIKYASDTPVMRYAKIAERLDDKTMRDVALRCRWMTRKEYGKRMSDDANSSRKNKDKKEKVGGQQAKPSANAINRATVLPYAQPSISVDTSDGDDIGYKAIGGPLGQLIEHNHQAMELMFANVSGLKLRENTNLLSLTRNNISIFNEYINDMPEVTTLSPLPHKLEDGFINYILNSSMQMNF